MPNRNKVFNTTPSLSLQSQNPSSLSQIHNSYKKGTLINKKKKKKNTNWTIT